MVLRISLNALIVLVGLLSLLTVRMPDGAVLGVADAATARDGQTATRASGKSASTKKPAAKAPAKSAKPTRATKPTRPAQATPASPAQAAKLKASIAEQQSRAQEARAALTALTDKERGLHRHLAGTEDQIKSAQAKVKAQESVLAGTRQKEEEARQEHARLEREREATAAELERLMVTLWPVEVRGMGSRMKGLDSWAEADRHFVWLAAVYGLTDARLGDLARQSRSMSENLALQARLNREAEAQLDAVNAEKDELLKKKLAFSRELSKVRSEKSEGEGELRRVMTAISSLNYQLKTLATVRPPVPAGREKTASRTAQDRAQAEIDSYEAPASVRGSMSWPSNGRLVLGYNPGANPAQRGLGFSSAEGAPVQAAGPGKVVHDDVLRGLGRVIIIFHGQETYSIYAFLAQSRVRMGQTVNRGETIGASGFYPALKGSGLYFELRFHQKAINPLGWLVAR